MGSATCIANKFQLAYNLTPPPKRLNWGRRYRSCLEISLFSGLLVKFSKPCGQITHNLVKRKHKMGLLGPFLQPQGGGTRIMDLDQYLEKMNTNTNVI